MSYIALPADGVTQYTLANRPSPATTDGEMIFISDVGIAGSYWISNGSVWSPVGGELVLAQSGATSSVTGTVSETTLATLTLPAGLFNPNAILEITMLWSYTNSANNKQMRIRLGGISGTVYFFQQPTTTASSQGFAYIRANNSTSSQKGWGTSTASSTGLGTIAASLVTSSLDMANTSNDLVITGQLASAGETISLIAYSIILR